MVVIPKAVGLVILAAVCLFAPAARAAAPQAVTPIGEAGMVTFDHPDVLVWRTQILSRTYTNPVVLMKPLSDVGGDPSMVRVRNVTGGAFEFQIDEWDYLNDGHSGVETWSYLVVEQGRHTLDDGTILEVGTVQASDVFAAVAYSAAFAASPVVVTQSQTENEVSAIVTRQQNVSATGFEVRVQEEEANDGAHAAETVGWMAIDAGPGSTGGIVFEAGVTGATVTDATTAVGFTQAFASPPTFVASIQTFNGADPVAIRYNSLTSTGVNVFLEEEVSADAETAHGSGEAVGYLLFPAGTIAVSSTAPPGGGGAAFTSGREGREDCGCSAIAGFDGTGLLLLSLSSGLLLARIPRRG